MATPIDNEISPCPAPTSTGASPESSFTPREQVSGTDAQTGEAGGTPSSPPPLYPSLVDSDWQKGKSVLASNRHMLEKQLACDVFFTVGRGSAKQTVGAHRYMLQSRSGVFFALLHNTGGSERGHSSNIPLPDTTPEVLWQLLRYLYFEDLHPQAHTALELLALAEKYEVTAARDQCLQFLRNHLAPQSVYDVLETSHRLGDAALERQCLQYVRQHGSTAVHWDGLNRLCPECLDKVLALEGSELSPSVIQDIRDRWAHRHDQDKDTSHEEKSMVDVLYVKRQHSQCFELTGRHVSREDVPQSPPPTYWEASMDLRRKAESETSASPISSTAPSEARSSQASCGVWAGFQHVTRFKNVQDDVVVKNGGQADAISFTVNRKIWLHGFGIYSIMGKEEASFRVDTVLTRKTEDVLMESIPIKGVGTILPVLFQNPVKIDKGKLYTLEIYVHGRSSRCGVNGMETVSDGQVTFTFSDNRKVKGNRTRVRKGQIPRLFYMPC